MALEYDKWTPELSAEATAHMEFARKRVEVFMQMRANLQQALAMTPEEFRHFLIEDEFKDLPDDCPKPRISLMKLYEEVQSRGGDIHLSMKIGDETFKILS